MQQNILATWSPHVTLAVLSQLLDKIHINTISAHSQHV